VNGAVKHNIHTYNVINASADLLVSLVNIESGARGFVITGRDQFLGPLESGERDFQSNLALLRQLTKDNPAQQRCLAETQTMHDQWLREYSNINLELRRQVVAGQQSFEALIERVAQMSMENSEAVADTSRTAQGLQQLALSLEKQVASFHF